MSNVIEITAQEYNKIISLESHIFELVASHEKASNILAKLCSLAESMLDGSVASIMLKDKATGKLNVISAPSIPQTGHDALANLTPGPGGGSCGNAVFRNEAQYVENTFEDERWSDLRQLAVDFNLCSCWSMPIKDESKNAVGSFALSSFEHRAPSLFHKKLLEVSSSIVSIVLKNQVNEQRLNLFSTAMENANEGVLVTDTNNKIIEVNRRFEEIYGFTEAEVLGKDPAYLSSGTNSKEFYENMWESINTTNSWSGEVINKHKDGTFINQWISISELFDEDDKLQNYFCVFSDITELKQTQKQIEFMAYHDSLTKLYNKTYLEKKLNHQQNISLILLNVDNFSYINTTYGFEFGDKLLIEISQHLLDTFNTACVFRINADEFGLIYEGKINLEEKIIDLREYFSNRRLTIENIDLKITFTYGAVIGDENLLRDATIALKYAKNSGKNNYHVYNKLHDALTFSNRDKFIKSSSMLHDALDEDRVIPYFQGIIDNKTAKITKFEALVRIQKDDEVISAYEFLEAAKLSGFLPDITKIMIDKSFKIMSQHEYTFSINITEEDLNKNYLVEYLKEKTKEYNIDSSRITLEILEGISSGSKSDSVKQLRVLQKLGYTIAIDDFGAEYSNFERVLDLDVGLLKIDAKYIKDIDVNKKSYEITRAMAYFAKNANIPCVAEFVHSKSVQKVIEELGIDYSQGFYFSEPAPYPQEF